MRTFAFSALAVSALGADQDCLVTPWTAWSSCSKSCDGGIHTRTRSVSVKAEGTGSACPELTDTDACNTITCNTKETCVLFEWSTWSTCSKDCFDGKNPGVQHRTRQVDPTSACENPTTTEERTCNTNVQCNCELSDNWKEWSDCTKTCGGGIQTREKTVTKEAVGEGMCNLDILEGRQRRACNEQKCPVEPVTAIAASGRTFVRLEDQSEVLAVTGDDTHLFSGKSKLESVSRSNMQIEQTRALGLGTNAAITALANDDKHVFVAVKGSNNAVNIEKIEKDDIESAQALKNTWVSGGNDSVLAMEQDADHLYVSLASPEAEGNTKILKIKKQDMSTVAHGELTGNGQAKALQLKNGRLTFGTWDGSVGTVAVTAVGQLSDADVHGAVDGGKLIAVVENGESVFFSTDPAAPAAGRVVKFLRANLDAAKDDKVNNPSADVASPEDLAQGAGVLAPGEKCTALFADWSRLYCGTNTGMVETLKQSDLTAASATVDMPAADPNAIAPPAFFAGTVVDSSIYLASFAGTSTLYKLDGFMAPQDCQLSQWSNWGACVNPSPIRNREILTCGTGGKFRKRAIEKQPKWGGTACKDEEGGTEDVAVCDTGKECCKGGKIWTKDQQQFTCNGLGAAITEATEACRCPATLPVSITSADATQSVCAKLDKDPNCVASKNAKVCEHISCAYLPTKDGGDRIVVKHTGAPNEFDWAATHNTATLREGLNNHKCTHAKGRMGGCTCLCWTEQEAKGPKGLKATNLNFERSSDNARWQAAQV